MKASMTQPHGNDALRWKISSNLRQAIFEDSGDDPITGLLYNFISGNTSCALAASDIISSISNKEDLATDISTQIIFLASEYPFLQPQLVDLITCLLSNPDLPEEPKAQCSSQLATTIGDTAASNYAHLFENQERTKDLIHDHINLHRFLARLLFLGGPVGLDDAMYMLSVGLEDHPESHKAPDIDVCAAAQYVIHAAKPIFDGCVKK